MIGYIKGQLVERGEGYVLVENNGIAYIVQVSNTTIVEISNSKEVKLYTYLNVKEDGLSLFGFYTKEEKNLFLKLISINGIGPKVALTILSGIELNRLIVAIVNQDVKTISQVKGIGKKTAERIVLELKENIDSSLALDNEAPVQLDVTETNDDDLNDAIYALRGLGFTQTEAVRAVKIAKPKAKDLQELISIALKSLN